jgi:hypothetical protein
MFAPAKMRKRSKDVSVCCSAAIGLRSTGRIGLDVDRNRQKAEGGRREA